MESSSKPIITLETVETVFKRAIENPLRGVPALIGPSQWGKTHYARLWFGSRTIVMVNPQCDLPEEVGGFPVRTRDTISFTQPSIIPSEFLEAKAPPWAIFIDELDKARDETTSSLLTLLNPAERRLRHTRVPDEVPIAVGMNEPMRPLPEPLVARLLFIPFPPVGFSMPQIACSNLLSPPEVRLPARPHAPGSYFKLKEWMNCPEFREDEAVRLAVVSGLFPAEVVPAVLENILGFNGRLEDWADNCTLNEFVASVFHVLDSLEKDAINPVMIRLGERAARDPEFDSVYQFVFDEFKGSKEWNFHKKPSPKDFTSKLQKAYAKAAKAAAKELMK